MGTRRHGDVETRRCGSSGRRGGCLKAQIMRKTRRYGVNIVGSEVMGLVPMVALIDAAVYYLGLEDFSMEQILEVRIME
jgi:hypothetical protein